MKEVEEIIDLCLFQFESQNFEAKSIFFTDIHKLIYNLYTKPQGEKNNLSILKKLIKTTSQFDKTKNGKILRILKNNKIIGETEFGSIILKPGEYLLGNGKSNSFQYRSDSSWYNSNFFFIKKNYIENIPENHLGRFYLNVNPRFINYIIKEIIKIENYHFLVKAFHNPEHFKRSDTLVIYFPLRDLEYFITLVTNIYSQNNDKFRIGVPFFLKKINPSVGFGENPPDNKYSFGSYRTECFFPKKTQIRKELRQKLIIETIEILEKKGFDLNHFHLNPFSVFKAKYEQLNLL